MKNKNYISIGIVILAIVGLYFFMHTKEVTAPVENIVPAQMDNLGNTDDLISFSIRPGVAVHGVLSYRGVIKGGYFFEGNILINVLDVNKKPIKEAYAVATTDWMTAGPVSFEGNIDFTGLSSGPAYFEIHNDNASGLPEHDKSILVPIIIQDSLKEYKNDKFSLSYNANTSLTEDIDKSGNIFNVRVSSIGEKNKEKGIYIYFADTNFDSEWCDKSIIISGKKFCANDTVVGDKNYTYRDGDKELIIWFTIEDPNALSDNRYIDLSSVEIK